MSLPTMTSNFTFPPAGPSSPPATPNSARSRKISGASFASFNRRKRHGFINLGLSPPEHITPSGPGHAFTYSPPSKGGQNSDSESEDSSSADEASLGSKGKTPVPESDHESDESPRRPSVVRTLDEDTDFSIEEVSEDDIAYDDAAVILPDQTQEADSGDESDILDALKKLQCGGQEEQERAHKFETAQRRSYQRRKKRWSVGGFHKRSHTESIGSQSSEHEDIKPLDNMQLPGAAARRLRRRTKGPDDIELPNRTSLLFEDPPREYDELAVIDEPPPYPEEFHFDHFDLWSSEDDEEPEEIELLLPAWLMEIESNPSRPSTTRSIASQVLGTE